jgi:hypothetical protein
MHGVGIGRIHQAACAAQAVRIAHTEGKERP